MKIALRSMKSGKFVGANGERDAISDEVTFEVVVVEGTLPGLAPPGPPAAPSEAGWWGPDRASLRAWVRAHYRAPNPTAAQIEAWVEYIIPAPGDDPDPRDNEAYWDQRMAE